MSLVDKKIDTNTHRDLLVLDKFKDFESETDFVVDFYLCVDPKGKVISIKPSQVIRIYLTS